MHNTENIIELLEDFIDFLKEKEDKKEDEKKNEVVVIEEEDTEANDDNFDKTIDKIAKGE